MSAVDTRIARYPYQCPWCPEVIAPGDVIWPLHIGTTDSSGCADCAWRVENNIPLFRGEPT